MGAPGTDLRKFTGESVGSSERAPQQREKEASGTSMHTLYSSSSSSMGSASAPRVKLKPRGLVDYGDESEDDEE